jgi:hypothetical protein
MHNSDNVDLVIEQMIDDPVRPLDYFTNVYVVGLVLSDQTEGMWQSAETDE